MCDSLSRVAARASAVYTRAASLIKLHYSSATGRMLRSFFSLDNETIECAEIISIERTLLFNLFSREVRFWQRVSRLCARRRSHRVYASTIIVRSLLLLREHTGDGRQPQKVKILKRIMQQDLKRFYFVWSHAWRTFSESCPENAPGSFKGNEMDGFHTGALWYSL